MSSKIACLAACLLGCGAEHVALSAPPASAPPAERIAAYEKLRPLAAAEAQTGIRGAAPADVLRTTEELQLAGGPRVSRAEDLLPVLPRDSEAARAAESSGSRNSVAGWLTAGGFALLAAGVIVGVSPFVSTEKGESIDLKPVYLGTGLVVLSLPVFLFSGAERRRAEDERATVFESYEPELRRRLDLCSRATALEACR